jgi:hypothetical protein
LPPDAARTAGRLLGRTADALWAGRAAVDGAALFPAAPGRAAALPVDLSTQVQALLVFEAHARVASPNK